MQREDGTHLTYCTNIHRGERLEEVRAALERHLPEVKRRVAPDRPFGLGLRLSAIAAEALDDTRNFDGFARLLADLDVYVFTLNGFPYGPFHGTRVKEEVYQPDWSTPERLAYTNRLADLLARLLPEEGEGSISTVPGTFRPLAAEPARLEAIATNLLRATAHLVDIERRTGRRIALAVEPEPACMVETTEEFVRFFEDRLAIRGALSEFARFADLPRGAAEEALRPHLGICFDVCHAAVEVEESLDLLERRAIAVPKLQLSAALRLSPVTAEGAAGLRPFEDAVYLHQVVARTPSGRLSRHTDLDEAQAALAAGEEAEEWRIHFHVPVFMAELEGPLATTQDVLARVLDRQRERPVSRHLATETYTFEVLPEAFRQVEIEEAVARELLWVRDRLGSRR